MGGGGGQTHKGGTVAVELPAALAGELEKEAKRSRKPVAKLLAGLLEDLADARDAEAAYKRYLKSGSKSYSMDEVFAELKVGR